MVAHFLAKVNLFFLFLLISHPQKNLTFYPRTFKKAICVSIFHHLFCFCLHFPPPWLKKKINLFCFCHFLSKKQDLFPPLENSGDHNISYVYTTKSHFILVEVLEAINWRKEKAVLNIHNVSKWGCKYYRATERACRYVTAQTACKFLSSSCSFQV